MFSRLADAMAVLTKESGVTRRVLADVPESSWTWRPHEKSRTAGELAWHLVTGLHWFAADPLKLKVAPKPASAPGSTSALLEAFDALTRDCLAALKKKDDAWIRRKADFFGTPTTNGGILGTHVVHEAHHRGQLALYIRLTGGKVPAVCGPSADDPGSPPPKAPRKAARAKP